MGSRKFRYGSAFAALAAAVSVAVSGCGTAGPAAPSSLDPARLAPAGSAAYVTVTVRPQGSQGAEVESALHKLFGARADAVIRRQADKLLRRAGTSYDGGVQKWLGQRVGLVVTGLGPGTAGSSGLSKNYVALIAPTNDPADARQFIQRELKKSPTATGGIVGGHYAVLGGPSAVQAVKAVAGGAPSLAASTAYQSDTGTLGSAEALAYVNLHDYARAFSALPQAAVLGPLLRQSLSRLGPSAALVLGLTTSGRQISFDVDRYGVKPAAGSGTSAPASVAGLPASSWLALATGGGAFSPQGQKQLREGFQLGLASALGRLQGVPGGAALGLIQQRLGFLEHTVLPALGPLSLSVSGTSPLGIAAGLQMTPTNPAAAGRLLGMLRGLAARDPSLQVSGSATNFSVQVPTGVRLDAAEQGGKVVVTYGFPSREAFLHPTATLGATPLYQQAVTQLPAGSSVPLFLNFGPIAALVQLSDHSPNAAKTVSTLHKLSYLIAGGRAGHARIVLGLN